MRSEQEIRSALERIEEPDARKGSYEELAAASEALRWVLGDRSWMLDEDERSEP